METHLPSISFLVCGWSSCLMKLGDNILNKPGRFFSSLKKNEYHLFLNCLHHKKKWIPDYFACKVVIVVRWHWWLFREIGNIHVRCGSQARTRHIDISKQGTSFGDEICEGLLRLHAFIGCDSVSAFGDKGNIPAFKLIIKESSEGQGIAWGRLGLICRTCRL